MNVNPVNDLRDALDALTKPVRTAIWQDTVDGEKRLIRREDRPLLAQLRAAIVNNVCSTGAGGKAAHERTPFDVAAFTMYEDIEGRVKSWAIDAGMTLVKDAHVEDVLRSWFTVWTVKVIPDELIHRHMAILDRWETAIEDLLDPPTKHEITAPCPLCGQMWATVGKGEDAEKVRSLWAVWRVNAEESYSQCRACGSMWWGVTAMRQLRIAIDDAEAFRTVA